MENTQTKALLMEEVKGILKSILWTIVGCMRTNVYEQCLCPVAMNTYKSILDILKDLKC